MATEGGESLLLQEVTAAVPSDNNKPSPAARTVTKAPDNSKPSAAARGVTKAPDGGWGWLVVLGVCVGDLTLGLIIKAFGVTYLILLDKFQASATATIWTGAITITCTLSTGPLASALCRQFGCRCVAMAGAAMVVTGVIATGQAPNIYVIYVTFGLLAGIGLGCIYTSGFIIISQYFDKRKALALSLTAVANGASDLIFPPLLLFLNREYGFPGMFLIMGGVCLHLFVGASLYRPLNPTVKSSIMVKPAKTKGIMCCIPSICQRGKLSVKDQDAKGECLTTLSEDNKQDVIKEKTMKERYLVLFKNYEFIAFAIASLSLSSASSMTSSSLPAMAVDNSVDTTKAAFLLAISGISEMSGSLALGHLFDVRAIRRFREHIYAGWCVVLGVGVLLMGVVSTYPAYVTLAVITGTATGLLMPQRITIIGDIVGKKSDMEGFGMSTFMNAFGGLIGRGIAGPIKDYSGRYNMAYLLAGGFILTVALVFEATVIRCKWTQRRQQQQTHLTDT